MTQQQIMQKKLEAAKDYLGSKLLTAKDSTKIKAIDDILECGPTFYMLPNYQGYLTQDAEGMDKLWRKFLTFIRDGLQENVDNLEVQNGDMDRV